jgi:hypothetical protein
MRRAGGASDSYFALSTISGTDDTAAGQRLTAEMHRTLILVDAVNGASGNECDRSHRNDDKGDLPHDWPPLPLLTPRPQYSFDKNTKYKSNSSKKQIKL